MPPCPSTRGSEVNAVPLVLGLLKRSASLNKRPTIGGPTKEINSQGWISAVVTVVVVIDEDVAIGVGEDRLSARAVDVCVSAK